MAPRRKPAPAPAAARKGVAKQDKSVNPLYEKRPKTFGVGNAPLPRRNLRRFVKWPKYVRLQRQRRILRMRLKVPPSINQFTKTLERNQADNVFRLLMKYRPEDKAAKKQRLLEEAKARSSGMDVDKKKPITVKYGINHITDLIETGKAQFVVIAHDVDPLELVLFLPALCKKMGVPYCIVKNKGRLGTVVHKKKATALALTTVKNEDQRDFSKIVDSCKSMYLEGGRIPWGGGIMGSKSLAKAKKKELQLQKEMANKV